MQQAPAAPAAPEKQPALQVALPPQSESTDDAQKAPAEQPAPATQTESTDNVQNPLVGWILMDSQTGYIQIKIHHVWARCSRKTRHHNFEHSDNMIWTHYMVHVEATENQKGLDPNKVTLRFLSEDFNHTFPGSRFRDLQVCRNPHGPMVAQFVGSIGFRDFRLNSPKINISEVVICAWALSS